MIEPPLAVSGRAGISPPRRNRIILIVALIVLVLSLLWAARGALFPYFLGLAMAYLLLPLVNWLDRGIRSLARGWGGSRMASILLTYLVVIGLLVGFFSLVFPVIGAQFRVLWESRDDLIEGGERLSERFLGWYRETIPEDIQDQVARSLQQAGGTVMNAFQRGLFQTVGVVTNVVSFVIGLVVIPFWLFYVLYDESRFTRRVVGMIPEQIRPDVVNIGRIADRTMGKYLRGQLLLCVFIGVIATVGLTLLGVRFPAVLGLIAGIFEILPFIGPIIGLVPAVIVATIQQPILGLWTLLLFLAIQQVENVLLVPRISGKAVDVHPALIMIVLVIGNQVAGLWGMILAVPLTAIIRDVFKYLYSRFQDQPLEPRDAMDRVANTAMKLDF